MSADNGIYVLETNAVPVFDGKATYTSFTEEAEN